MGREEEKGKGESHQIYICLVVETIEKKKIKQCKEMKRMILVFKIEWSWKIYLIE